MKTKCNKSKLQLLEKLMFQSYFSLFFITLIRGTGIFINGTDFIIIGNSVVILVKNNRILEKSLDSFSWLRLTDGQFRHILPLGEHSHQEYHLFEPQALESSN